MKFSRFAICLLVFVYAQSYHLAYAQSDDFEVNSTTQNKQTDPDVAVLADGRHVVVWTDYSPNADTHAWGIKAQILDKNGAAKGSEFIVNDIVISGQWLPKVTGLADGGFVVMWEDNSEGGVYVPAPDIDPPGVMVSSEVRALIFDENVSPRGKSFRVNSVTRRSQDAPSDAIGLDDGGFALAWKGYPWAPYVHVYNSDGSHRAEFEIKATPPNYQQPPSYQQGDHPSLVPLPLGSFGATYEQTTPGNGFVWYGRYNASANPISPPTMVKPNVFPRGTQPKRSPDLARNINGVTMAVWAEIAKANITQAEIWANFIDNSGTLLLNNPILVNTTQSSHQSQPKVTALPNGRFAVVWKDESTDSGDIRARIFSDDGQAVKLWAPLDDKDFLLGSSSANLQQMPAIAADSDCGFMAVWHDESQSGSDKSESAVRALKFCDEIKFDVTKSLESCRPGPAFETSICDYKIILENKGANYNGDLVIKDVMNVAVWDFALHDDTGAQITCLTNDISSAPITTTYDTGTVTIPREDICTIPNVSLGNNDKIEFLATATISPKRIYGPGNIPLNCAVVSQWNGQDPTLLETELPSNCIMAIDKPTLTCSNPNDNGMTWALRNTHASGAIRVGGDNRSNPSVGDTQCSTELPLLCIKMEALPKPNALTTPSRYHQWTGGTVQASTPVAACQLPKVQDASDYCAAEFGTGWRIAEFHDGQGHSLWAYGNLNPVPARYWTDINDKTRANCWDR